MTHRDAHESTESETPSVQKSVQFRIEMDPNLSKWVDMAAEIDASERPSMVSRRIEELTAEFAGAWSVRVFRSLYNQLSSEYSLLKNTYRDSVIDSPQLAWRARNLLEICVWCRYCCKSSSNARRFYEDAGRDAIGIVDVFTEWGATTGREKDWMESLQSQRQAISRDVASAGVASLSGRYKEVREAAKEVGMKEQFRVGFRMLSKFAHPTAMQILGKATPKNISVQKDTFLSWGCLFFIGGFVELEMRLQNARPE
jgi:hypothetical protein